MVIQGSGYDENILNFDKLIITNEIEKEIKHLDKLYRTVETTRKEIKPNREKTKLVN